jgi:hypothetical protein
VGGRKLDQYLCAGRSEFTASLIRPCESGTSASRSHTTSIEVHKFDPICKSVTLGTSDQAGGTTRAVSGERARAGFEAAAGPRGAMHMRRVGFARNQVISTRRERGADCRAGVGASGRETIENWRTGTHDDVVFAVPLACWQRAEVAGSVPRIGRGEQSVDRRVARCSPDSRDTAAFIGPDARSRAQASYYHQRMRRTM